MHFGKIHPFSFLFFEAVVRQGERMSLSELINFHVKYFGTKNKFLHWKFYFDEILFIFPIFIGHTDTRKAKFLQWKIFMGGMKCFSRKKDKFAAVISKLFILLQKYSKLNFYDEDDSLYPPTRRQHLHSAAEKSVCYAFSRVLYMDEKSVLFQKSELCIFAFARARIYFYCSFRAPWVLWVAHFLYTFIGIYLLLKK